MSTRALLYSRDLPGGGFVAIDARPGSAAGAEMAAGEAREHHARLWVERRSDPARRAGHTPPVIARAAGRDLEGAVAELRAIAADNVALALAMRRWARGAAPP